MNRSGSPDATVNEQWQIESPGAVESILVLELFAFIALCLAMMASGKAVVIFSLITIVLVIWIPFQANAGNRLTRALSIALPIAAIARTVVHFLPNPSL
ncbi:hypothetical protein [Stenotrophomonas sp. GbtcB23]|uniref:hypothetical protein n=1 Tax=Stenotrophomonas sp. GbtcB23 TaxID=2824768 RepID=UPI001C2F9D62|nr:hypothetical protein [Stenotrophomonas sp. GbtcB23]